MSKPMFLGLHEVDLNTARHSSGAFEGVMRTEWFTADTDAVTGGKVLRLRFRPAKQSVHSLASPIVTKDPAGTPVIYAHGTQVDTEGPASNTCFIDYVSGIIRVPDGTTTEIFKVDYYGLDVLLRPTDFDTAPPATVAAPTGSGITNYPKAIIPLTDAVSGLLASAFLFPFNPNLAANGSTTIRPLIQSGYPTDATFSVYVEDDGVGTSAVSLVWGAVWDTAVSEWNPDPSNPIAYRLVYKPHSATSPLLYSKTHGGANFADGGWVLVTYDVWIPYNAIMGQWTAPANAVDLSYWYTSTDTHAMYIRVPGDSRSRVVSGFKFDWINDTSVGFTDITVKVWTISSGGSATLQETDTFTSNATTLQSHTTTISPALTLSADMEIIFEIICDDKAGGTLKAKHFCMVTT